MAEERETTDVKERASSKEQASLKEQKCAACGGPLRFAPEQGKLVCDYCGSVFDIPEPAEKTQQEAEAVSREMALEGFDFNSLDAMIEDPDAAALPIYNCVSCGADVIAPAEQVALTCPYCRNNIVLTDKVSGNLRPNGVIPFRITAEALPAAVRRYYKGKVLLPKRFFSSHSMGAVTGVYVPFWVFSGTVQGDVDFDAHQTHISRQGNYEITEKRHYILSRRVAMSFRDVPVDASGRIPDALMDTLEPFDMTDVKPFDMRYLAGFTADRFDVPKATVAGRAKARMLKSAEAIAAGQVRGGYSGVSRRGGKLKLDIDARYLMLPVYLFDLVFAGKSYHFAVNGQSGKVVGKLPTDRRVSIRYFLVRMLAVLAAVLIYFVTKYLIGR